VQISSFQDLESLLSLCVATHSPGVNSIVALALQCPALVLRAFIDPPIRGKFFYILVQTSLLVRTKMIEFCGRVSFQDCYLFVCAVLVYVANLKGLELPEGFAASNSHRDAIAFFAIKYAYRTGTDEDRGIILDAIVNREIDRIDEYDEIDRIDEYDEE
jgi:hypothetical protein